MAAHRARWCPHCECLQSTIRSHCPRCGWPAFALDTSERPPAPRAQVPASPAPAPTPLSLPPEQRTGFSVESDPAGALVFLDRVLVRDKTPCPVRGVTPGPHHLRLRFPSRPLEYHDWEGTVEAEAGHVVSVTCEMEAVTPEQREARETTAREWLKALRQGLERFRADCGCYPASLGDLLRQASEPPASGLVLGAAVFERVPLPASKFRGPYVKAEAGQLPRNPLTDDFDWHYGPEHGDPVPEIRLDLPGADSSGVRYSDW